jgi:drug/metabolite transporter (DMT)-like permease
LSAPAASPGRALSGAAFATLLLIAFIMGANHVAARFAFNDGVDVATAVASRSAVTAVVVAVLIALQGVTLHLTPRQRRFLPIIGALIAVQSYCLYSAVARLPVALALLTFNSFPIAIALWQGLLYRSRPPRIVLILMPLILIGLTLALDVFGAASGLGAAGQWAQIGAGVAFALAAALIFGLALVLTQHETVGLDGRVRTCVTMTIVALLAGLVMAAQGGPQWPQSSNGWWGLAALTLLYGTGITILFTVLPRLGVAANSPIMNIEPIFALVLAWLVLGQSIAPVQVAGSAIVVGAVMALGLRRS